MYDWLTQLLEPVARLFAVSIAQQDGGTGQDLLPSISPTDHREIAADAE